MPKKIHAVAVSLCITLLFLVGCQQEQQTPAKIKVEANQAYLDSFGEPPLVQKGQAFARVGYLPLRETPARLQALPFYLLDGQNQLQQVLNRLISNEVILPPDSPLYQPFPAGLQIEVSPVKGGNVTLTLRMEKLPGDKDLTGMIAALTETAVQFPEIKNVRILINEAPPKQMPPTGFTSQPERIAEVSLPEALMIAGMWERGENLLSEIVIDFNRPVKVNHFALYDASGSKVEGEYFTSAFDMAVIVHPDSTENYQDGSPLKAEWDITDALGRNNKGTSSFSLRRYEH